MDSFTERFNKAAGQYTGDRNSFSESLAMRQNNAINRTFNLVKDEDKRYRDFLYEYNRALFVHDNAKDIYLGSSDPREEAHADDFANMLNALNPQIPVDVARKG